MTRRHYLRFQPASFVCLVFALCGIPPTADAATYRWVDDKGMAHYSDTVPTQDVKNPYQKLDKWGNVDLEVEGQLTEAQRAIERQRREQADAEHDQIHRQQVRDRVLLETYADTSQLAAERDQSLATADASIAATRNEIERLARRRDELLDRKNSTAASEGQEGLEGELADVSRRIGDERTLLDQHLSERDTIAAKYAADIARLEQLRTGGSASPRPRP